MLCINLTTLGYKSKAQVSTESSLTHQRPSHSNNYQNNTIDISYITSLRSKEYSKTDYKVKSRSEMKNVLYKFKKVPQTNSKTE